MKTQSLTDVQKDKLAKLLYKYQFFSSYTKRDFDRILPAFSYIEYSTGEVVFSKGSRADAIFIIDHGHVDVVARKKLSLFSSKVAQLGPGDCFGEMSIIDHTVRQGTITAVDALGVFVFSCSDFDTFFEDNPSFKDALRALAKKRR